MFPQEILTKRFALTGPCYGVCVQYLIDYTPSLPPPRLPPPVIYCHSTEVGLHWTEKLWNTEIVLHWTKNDTEQEQVDIHAPIAETLRSLVETATTLQRQNLCP